MVTAQIDQDVYICLSCGYRFLGITQVETGVRTTGHPLENDCWNCDSTLWGTEPLDSDNALHQKLITKAHEVFAE